MVQNVVSADVINPYGSRSQAIDSNRLVSINLLAVTGIIMRHDAGGNVLVMHQINRTGFDTEYLVTAAGPDFSHQFFTVHSDGNLIANFNITGHVASDGRGRLLGLNFVQHIVPGHRIQNERRIRMGINRHGFVVDRRVAIARCIMPRHADMNRGIRLKIGGADKLFIAQLAVHMR